MKSTFLAGGVAFIVGTADGQIPATELPAAIAEAKPGDVIVVRDGIYPNHNLSLSGAGTAEAPIIIRAETPGGVIFSGQSALRLRTDFAIVSGFHFKEGASPEKYVIEVDGKHCRLTEVVIESYNPKDSKKEDKWVSLKGTNHRVDASSFMNKTSRSVTLIVWRQKGGAESHVIAGNLFLGRPKGASGNGFETIRIGTSDESESDSGTVIEGNLFESCDGEMEALSIKAGKVT
ncbi:polysaccharide lyase 6 family protein, partial [Verrucomicrobiales bacterium]|nr:polysaccharide lyase 6 family protein [Verrucomicrobiales bacterium]